MPFVIPATPVTGTGTPGHQFSDITLNDADGLDVDLHRTDSRHIYAATGLIGVTPPRQVVRPRPSAHGSINNTRNTEGRLIVLEGRLLGEQSATDMFTEFYAVAGAMLETLDYGEALLKWTIDGGASMQAMVKLHGELEPPVEVGPNILAYQAQLFAQDPRAYDQSQSSSTGDPLSSAPGGWTFPRTMPIRFNVSVSGTAAVENLGNRPTPPVFRVYGMAVNPQILLLGTDYRIALTGTISAGDYLEVDVQNRTLMMNGTTSALYFLDAANTQWFELPKGTSTVQMLAGAFDTSAKVSVLYRARTPNQENP
jgi:hypothetical protein